MHVKDAQRTLGSRFTWLCDTMANDLKHALGDMPNSEFVLDPECKVVRKRAWSSPAELRKDLEELVGKVDKPTQVADVGLKVPPIRQASDDGKTPRLKLPGRMQPLRVEPLADDKDIPFYVKLRAEADDALLRERKGKLYLGFFLDPIYKVHWNNLSAPLRFEIKPSAGVVVVPASAQAPKVEAAEDRNPREFLVEVSPSTSPSGVVELTVFYVACDDAGTFCNPLTQRYRIHLERDRDGGARRTGGSGPGLARSPEEMLKRIAERDKDGDGKISREEAPERLKEMFERADSNRDGLLDVEELKAWFSRMGKPGREEPRPSKTQGVPPRYVKTLRSISTGTGWRPANQRALDQFQSVGF